LDFVLALENRKEPQVGVWHCRPKGKDNKGIITVSEGGKPVFSRASNCPYTVLFLCLSGFAVHV